MRIVSLPAVRFSTLAFMRSSPAYMGSSVVSAVLTLSTVCAFRVAAARASVAAVTSFISSFMVVTPW
jgi:hypothetical protein